LAEQGGQLLKEEACWKEIVGMKELKLLFIERFNIISICFRECLFLQLNTLEESSLKTDIGCFEETRMYG